MFQAVVLIGWGLICIQVCQAAELLVDIPSDFPLPPSSNSLYQFRIHPMKLGSDERNVTFTVLDYSTSNLTLPFTVYGVEPSTMYSVEGHAPVKDGWRRWCRFHFFSDPEHPTLCLQHVVVSSTETVFMWGHPNNRKLTGKSFAVRVDSRSKDAEGKYDASPLLQRHTDQTELQLSSLIPDQTYVMTVFENAPDFPQMELKFVQNMSNAVCPICRLCNNCTASARCSLTSSSGSLISTTDIDFAPTITCDPPEFSAIGAEAKFSCTVSAQPAADIFWLEGDFRHRMTFLTPEELDHRDWVTNYKVLENGTVQTVLYGPHTTDADFLSTFHCIAVNDMGQAKQTVKLQLPLSRLDDRNEHLPQSVVN